MEQAPGFYGKLPQIGDFISRRLPAEFLDPWDEWLQSGIAVSREQLTDRWLEIYLTSPIWNFVLGRGVCGEFPWCGLIMPSVDKVGRYFPLTVACRLPLDSNPIAVATWAKEWFEQAEADVLSALFNEDLDVTTFDSNVTRLGQPLSGDARIAVSAAAGYGSAWQLPLTDGNFTDGLPELTHQLLMQRSGNYSLWWGSGSDNVEPSLLVCNGLPLCADFSALLTGDWQTGGWESWALKHPETGVF